MAPAPETFIHDSSTRWFYGLPHYLGKLTLHPMVSSRYIHNRSKGPTLVHCPSCRGILVKTLNPKHCGIKQPFILFMRCPHCLKNVKMEMVEGSEEKILIEVIDSTNHKTS